MRITVTDTGIGISPEQQTKLFRSFEQADNGISRRFGGTGLGLAISKNIVEMMGGSVELSSALGEGSSFTVLVPVAEGNYTDGVYAENDALSGEDIENTRFGGLRVLLAEDVDINREILMALLAENEITFTCTENGAEAVAAFTAAPDDFDLILMDIQMPELDGYGAPRTIRALDHPRA